MFPSLSSLDSVSSSPSSSLPAFHPWLVTLLPLSVLFDFDSSINTTSSPVFDTTPATVPNVSPPISASSVSTNTRPTLTRSKSDIFKPKAYDV